MLMKDGTLVPKPLTEALEEDIQALRTFINMSQTYQILCVRHITRSNRMSMRGRIEKAMEEIRKYGEGKVEDS